MKIKKAHRTDANKITDLTIRSKDFWNYGAEQIAEWKDDLTITSDYIDENQVFKLSVENEIIGFYAFNSQDKNTVKLNFLFVEPKFIGKGYGKILLNDFLKRMEETDYDKITLDADPNVENFYTRAGFKVVGRLQSSIKNRYLPIMEMEIKPAYNNV
ncbi:GNAT family N-acetyltransferase [Muricauda ruestringensis]|uniref:N-acetyltransferase n=1 Tax=Flagellimonas marinaquae TaxID=254955 RepID=A0AA48HQS4_9FLAO|nr:MULTISPECIES: GNAT family N-acetyltransferase [Allomuricauda]MCA0960022.1 GNAT family N-acetyltransferase [Allomuricauda ruestringensis]USD24955.1 GNAT family N-acetyltransferase [Allomuricauda aquimarina]BDW93959.1 N-acetyltransferase [Allomuricauda aquimarina]